MAIMLKVGIGSRHWDASPLPRARIAAGARSADSRGLTGRSHRRPDLHRRPARGRGAALPLTTAQCERPRRRLLRRPQIQQAYDLPALYRDRGDRPGPDDRHRRLRSARRRSPTTSRSSTSTYGLPAPPSLRVIQPAGAVPPVLADRRPARAGPARRRSTSSTRTPSRRARTSCSSRRRSPRTRARPGSRRSSRPRSTSSTTTSAASSARASARPSRRSRPPSRCWRCAAPTSTRPRHGVTVLAASGDSGAADVGDRRADLLPHPVDVLAGQRPAGHRRRRHPAAPRTRPGQHTAPDTVWNDTYNVATQSTSSATTGPTRSPAVAASR